MEGLYREIKGLSEKSWIINGEKEGIRRLKGITFTLLIHGQTRKYVR